MWHLKLFRFMSVMMVQTWSANWTTLSYLSNCSIFRAKNLETTSATEKQHNLKNGKVRFHLTLERRWKTQGWMPLIKQPIPFVKGRLNFSSKTTRAAKVPRTKSLLDNWLKNNHITVDKIYYLRSLFVSFFLRILVFKFISQPQKTEKHFVAIRLN